MMKKINVSNQPDLLDDAGLWVTSYMTDGNIQNTTRSAGLWWSLKERTNPSSHHRKCQPSYEGSENLFADFQEFSSWCQEQHGYLNKDSSGRFWQLDKDFISGESKIYSPETCLFIPSRLNKLFSIQESRRGETPLGVYLETRSQKYVAQCYNAEGKKVRIGSYIDSMEAHQAWQRFKIQVVENYVSSDNQILNHEKLLENLVPKIDKLKVELYNGIETFKIL